MKYEPISTDRFRSTRLTGKTLGAKPSILGSNPRWISDLTLLPESRSVYFLTSQYQCGPNLDSSGKPA